MRIVVVCCWCCLYILGVFYFGVFLVGLSDEVKKFIEKVVEKTVRDEIVKILPSTVVTREDLRLAIESMNRRFEAVDKRFEDMNRRFEDMFRLLRIMFITISLLIAIFGFLGIYVG